MERVAIKKRGEGGVGECGFSQGRETISETLEFSLSEEAAKKVILFLSLLFSWGCIYFGSLEEPFYAEDSEYRKEVGRRESVSTYVRKVACIYLGFVVLVLPPQGGDGSSNWFYTKDEETAIAERAKLAAAPSSESQADDSASTASS